MPKERKITILVDDNFDITDVEVLNLDPCEACAMFLVGFNQLTKALPNDAKGFEAKKIESLKFMQKKLNEAAGSDEIAKIVGNGHFEDMEEFTVESLMEQGIPEEVAKKVYKDILNFANQVIQGSKEKPKTSGKSFKVGGINFHINRTKKD